MRKTTVYLTDEEAEALRRKAAEDGRTQSELIREGVRRVVGEPRRVFRSLGVGRGDGTHPARWGGDPEALRRWAAGEKPPQRP